MGEDGLTWSTLRYPLMWIGVTVASAGFAWHAMRPQPCQHVAGCGALLDETSGVLNNYAFCGLATVFLHELASLVLNYRTARPLRDLIDDVMETFKPSVLLCTTFAVLLLENLVLMGGPSAALIHSASALRGEGHLRPVYTIIYMEWLINVPLLIILAGHCALGRSMAQISGVLLVTNVYIVIAWASYFIPGYELRWVAVLVSFLMYGWASKEMARWALEFRRSAPPGAHSRGLRPFVTLALIIVFGIYGALFLCSMLGKLTTAEEKAWYTSLNIGVKLSMSMGFAGIRSAQYHELLVEMIVNTHLPFQRQVADLADQARCGSMRTILEEPLLD